MMRFVRGLQLLQLSVGQDEVERRRADRKRVTVANLRAAVIDQESGLQIDVMMWGQETFTAPLRAAYAAVAV
jgi:hypothetical protein